MALQASISEFTNVGGLQAVEERLIAVQDYEAKLEELDKQAETYQVRSAVPLFLACVIACLIRRAGHHWPRFTHAAAAH